MLLRRAGLTASAGLSCLYSFSFLIILVFVLVLLNEKESF